MKNLGKRIPVFVILVLAFPLLQHLHKVMPQVNIPGYENSDSFFFWLFKAIAFLVIVFAWRLSINDNTYWVYKYGITLVLLYGIAEFWLVIPTFSGDSISFPWIIVLTLFTGVPLLFAIVRIGRKLTKGKVETMVEDLETERIQNHILEHYLDETNRKLKEIGDKPLGRIKLNITHFTHLVNSIQKPEDIVKYEPILQYLARDVAKATQQINELVKTDPLILKTKLHDREKNKK